MGSEREPRERFVLYTKMGTLKQWFSESLRTPWGQALKKECPERVRFGGSPGRAVSETSMKNLELCSSFLVGPVPLGSRFGVSVWGGPGIFGPPWRKHVRFRGGPFGHHFWLRFGGGFGRSWRPPSGRARSHPETEALQKRLQNGVPGRVKLQTVVHFAHGGVAVWSQIGSARVPGRVAESMLQARSLKRGYWTKWPRARKL